MSNSFSILGVMPTVPGAIIGDIPTFTSNGIVWDSGYSISSGSLTSSVSTVPTSAAVLAAIGGAITSSKSFRGGYDASSNLFPIAGGSGVAGAVQSGDVWNIIVNGTLGGQAAVVGNTILALVSTPGQAGANWLISNTLTDVVINNPLVTQYVRYDGSTWVNAYVQFSDMVGSATPTQIPNTLNATTFSGTTNPIVRNIYTGLQNTMSGGATQNVQDDGIAIANGNRLGSFSFLSVYDNTHTYAVGAATRAFATQTWTSTANGTQLKFLTTQNNSTAQIAALTLDQDQSAIFANTVNATTFVGSLAGNSSTATSLSAGVLGSVPYQSAVNTTSFVSPNTAAIKKVYKMTGSGTIGAPPIWEQATIAEDSDYSAGTFTPVLGFSTAGDLSVVYGDRIGSYVKIPGLCTVQIIITTTTFLYTTASGALQISGLPFTVANPLASGSLYYGVSSPLMRGYTNPLYTEILAGGRINTNIIRLLGQGSGVTPSLLSTTDVVSGSIVTITLTLSYPI